ncbi:hypothetical protein YW7DRAFT_01064 [Streptomyces sp. AmelKG-E11A]|nr:hypothetical protein YW7DRAFT_01064 [Streptomyces sp. AmelKG-E11A]
MEGAARCRQPLGRPPMPPGTHARGPTPTRGAGARPARARASTPCSHPRHPQEGPCPPAPSGPHRTPPNRGMPGRRPCTGTFSGDGDARTPHRSVAGRIRSVVVRVARTRSHRRRVMVETPPRAGPYPPPRTGPSPVPAQAARPDTGRDPRRIPARPGRSRGRTRQRAPPESARPSKAQRRTRPTRVTAPDPLKRAAVPDPIRPGSTRTPRPGSTRTPALSRGPPRCSSRGWTPRTRRSRGVRRPSVRGRRARPRSPPAGGRSTRRSGPRSSARRGAPR